MDAITAAAVVESTKPNKMRASHKAFIGLAGVVLSISQLKEIKEFIVGDTAAAIARIEKNQASNFAELKGMLVKQDDDNVAKFRRIRDLTTADLVASEGRCSQKVADVKLDVRELQVFAYKSRSSKSQN